MDKKSKGAIQRLWDVFDEIDYLHQPQTQKIDEGIKIPFKTLGKWRQKLIGAIKILNR